MKIAIINKHAISQRRNSFWFFVFAQPRLLIFLYFFCYYSPYKLPFDAKHGFRAPFSVPSCLTRIRVFVKTSECMYEMSHIGSSDANELAEAPGSPNACVFLCGLFVVEGWMFVWALVSLILRVFECMYVCESVFVRLYAVLQHHDRSNGWSVAWLPHIQNLLKLPQTRRAIWRKQK